MTPHTNLSDKNTSALKGTLGSMSKINNKSFIMRKSINETSNNPSANENP